MAFQTRTTGSDNSNMNTRLYIKSSGNVGIGTTSPGSLLDVNGNVNCTSFTNSGTLTACNTTVSNLTVNGIVQNALQFPANNPWLTMYTKYGATDYYGYGQFGTGTVRAVISGSFTSASFQVSRPNDSNLATWSNLLSVDYYGNAIVQNNLSVNGTGNTGGAMSVGGNLNLNGGSMSTQNGSLTILDTSKTTSNFTVFNDGSSKFRNGAIIQQAQVGSAFSGDATFGNVSCFSTTGFALIQNSTGTLTTTNASSGGSVRTAVNGTLTSSFNASTFSIGTDSLNVPAWSNVANSPVIVAGGYTAFSGLTGTIDLSPIWGSTLTTSMGELKIFVKTRVINHAVSCMVSIYISRQAGNQATFVQNSYYNNGCSAASYSINSYNQLVINMNSITGSPALFGTFLYQGIL